MAQATSTVTYVLDASAMIAVLNDEVGADFIEAAVSKDDVVAFAHVINLVEVFYDMMRRGSEADAQQALIDLAALGIETRSDMDDAFWQEAARLKAVHRRISLADCFGLTLARQTGGAFITSDHHEMDAIAQAGICSISFFR